MLKHTLFVCQSCHHSSEKRLEQQTIVGDRLLEQLNTLASEQLQSDEFGIQPVAYLWTCGQPCAVAFSAPHKLTYLFTNLLMKLPLPCSSLANSIEIYRDKKTGNVPWEQFPEMLQSVSVAKVPAVGWKGEAVKA
jgi:predicted metal-binding protein